VAGDLAKVVAAAALMGALVAAGWWLRQALLPATKAMDAVAVVGLVGLGAASYGALLWGLKIEGRADLAAVLGGLRRKFS
jgi:putative peptidoglycan lipid II flippase